MEYHEFHAMNTAVLLAAEGPEDVVRLGFAQTQAFIEAAEKRFTRFSEQSELARLNRSSGSWFEASPEMYEVIAQAVLLHTQTGGLFDPSILSALEHAGYDRSMDEIRARGGIVPPAADEFARPSRSRFRDLLLDQRGQRVWMPAGLRIDLGGIAKGWIAERAALILFSSSKACAVNAGGDMFLCGTPSGETAWPITLEDPCNSDRALAVIESGPGAVVTSTITRRRWQQGGQERHHLIDPRTGKPAETDWLSVTVMAPHAAQAEAYAKCLLLGSADEAGRIAASAGIEFIAVDPQARMWGSAHSHEYLKVLQ